MTQKVITRILFLLVVTLALWGGLGWERARQAIQSCGYAQQK